MIDNTSGLEAQSVGRRRPGDPTEASLARSTKKHPLPLPPSPLGGGHLRSLLEFWRMYWSIYRSCPLQKFPGIPMTRRVRVDVVPTVKHPCPLCIGHAQVTAWERHELFLRQEAPGPMREVSPQEWFQSCASQARNLAVVGRVCDYARPLVPCPLTCSIIRSRREDHRPPNNSQSQMARSNIKRQAKPSTRPGTPLLYKKPDR